jgi:hypothetical protein
MTNGGMYDNVTSIDDEHVDNITPVMLERMLMRNEFIKVIFQGKKALVKTSCISSINL